MIAGTGLDLALFTPPSDCESERKVALCACVLGSTRARYWTMWWWRREGLGSGGETSWRWGLAEGERNDAAGTGMRFSAVYIGQQLGQWMYE